MNICIDALGASCLMGTGLYTYTFELLNNLYEIYPQPTYKILWDGHNEPPFREYKNVAYVNLKIDRINNDYSLLDDYIANNNIHIYHSPNNGFSVPNNDNVKYIMAVHDIMPVIREEYTDSKYNAKFMNVFPKSIKKAYRIIAVSDYLKEQIVDKFKIDDKKVKTIYPGCSKQFTQLDKGIVKNILMEKFGIDKEYILYAGSMHVRKNIKMLLSAYRESGIYKRGIGLVMAGMCGGKRREYFLKLKEMCQSMGIEDNVIFTDRVDYNDMVYVYNGSLCFVNLSSSEGFPFTTVEAMACGTPTISLRNHLFREIAGDGGIFVRNEDELCDELYEVIRSTSYRNKIIERGLRQSKKYTWEKHIKGLVKIYESAVYGE